MANRGGYGPKRFAGSYKPKQSSPPAMTTESRIYDRLLVDIREVLGVARTRAGLEAGRMLGLEDAATYALELLSKLAHEVAVSDQE
jgi:hypothetical protein